MLGGNHDHGLVAGWIDGRLLTEPRRLPRPRAADRAARRRAARRRARRARPARPRVSSPTPACGCATTSSPSTATTPTCTRPCPRSSASPPARWRASGHPDARRRRAAGRLRGGAGTAVRVDARAHPALRPRGRQRRRGRLGAGLGARWRGRGRRRRPIRTTLLGAGFRIAVAGINATGLGPVAPDLTGPGLRSGYLYGIREVLRRLGVDAAHVIWGHSHRAGPVAGRRPRRVDHPAGGRIVNTGSWVYQAHFLSRSRTGRRTGRAPRC